VQEKSLEFDKRYLNIKNNNYVSGYRQSYKYFDTIRDVLLKDFEPKEKLDHKNQLIVNKMKSTDSV